LPDDDDDDDEEEEEEEEEEFDDDDDMVPSDSEELTTPSVSDAQGPEGSSSSSASSIKNKSGPYILPVKPISNKVGTVTMNMFTDKNASSSATTSTLNPDQDVSSINLNLDALTSGLAIKEPPQLLSSVKMIEAMKAKSTATVTAAEAPPTTSDQNCTVAAAAIANVSADE